MFSKPSLSLWLLVVVSLSCQAQQDATSENEADVPMDMIIYKSGTVFQGQIVEGKKTLIDQPNRYEIVLENGQIVSIEDTGQIETIKMDGQVLKDPLRHGGRGRLLEMIEEYRKKQSAKKREQQKSRLTAKVVWVLGEPRKGRSGEESQTGLQVGSVVLPGEEVRTPSNGRIQLRVASFFTIALEQGALLRITSIEFGASEREVVFEFDLERGRMWVERTDSENEEDRVILRTANLELKFPHGLKRFWKNSEGELVVVNYEGPTLEIARLTGTSSEPVVLPSRTQARISSLMLSGKRALKPEIAQVGDPIDWFEFTTWKPIEIDLPVQFTLTRYDHLQGRPLRPIMGVSSSGFVFQDLQPIRMTGLAPLFTAYRQSLNRFLADTGRLPTPEEGLAVLRSASGEIEGWNGPYLKDEIPETDPWNHPIQYSVIQYNEKSLINLYSVGENGIDEQGLGDDLR